MLIVLIKLVYEPEYITGPSGCEAFLPLFYYKLQWLFTKDLVNKKWRSRNKNYLKEFERISQKALEYENIDRTTNK